MSEHELEPRVAALEVETRALVKESDRTRDRLHNIESDRASIQLLTAELSRIRYDLTQVPDIVSREASKAVQAALRTRDSDRARGMGLRMQFIMAILAVGGIVSTVWLSLGQHP